MKVKKSDDYFTELQNMLSLLTTDEQSDVIKYYQQYAKKNNLITYERLCQVLGYPNRLGRQILADYSIWIDDDYDQDNNIVSRSKRHFHLFWVIILGITASPIILPVALILITFLIVLALVILTIVLVISLGLIGAMITVVMSFVGGVEVFSQSGWVGLYFISISIIGAGLLLIFVPICWWLVINLVQLGLNISKYIGQKVILRQSRVRGANHEN